MNAEFALKVRLWRGKRTQSVAAYLLGVPIETYRSWEYARAVPNEWRMPDVEEKMAANPELFPDIPSAEGPK